MQYDLHLLGSEILSYQLYMLITGKTNFAHSNLMFCPNDFCPFDCLPKRFLPIWFFVKMICGFALVICDSFFRQMIFADFIFADSLCFLHLLCFKFPSHGVLNTLAASIVSRPFLNPKRFRPDKCFAFASILFVKFRNMTN